MKDESHEIVFGYLDFCHSGFKISPGSHPLNKHPLFDWSLATSKKNGVEATLIQPKAQEILIINDIHLLPIHIPQVQHFDDIHLLARLSTSKKRSI